VSESADILLLADPAAAEAMGEQIAPTGAVLCSDPYEALKQMGERRWDVVVLAAQREEYDGLCRAGRRLQPSAKFFGLCQPADEPIAHGLTPKLLDDYFVYPLSSADLADLRSAAGQEQPTDRPAQPAATAALAGHGLAELLAAAGSVSSLEAHVAAMVGEALDAEPSWISAADLSEGREVLLLTAGELPRALVVDGGIRIDPDTRAMLATLQESLPSLLQNARRIESLHRLAITDHLTGAYNRRYFYHLTDQILARARLNNLRVTLLLYDIDDFKRYNDTYGYAAGDEILRETAKLVRKVTRSHDIVARIGGDEFAVLFWDSGRPRNPQSHPVDNAFALADRFRRAVGRHLFEALGPEAQGVLSISGGLANFPTDGQTCRELLRSADAAIKAAKRSGKNSIRIIGKD